MDFDGNHLQDSYLVEVSGWDADESFFVETTNLAWTAAGMKEISLCRSVREGAVIFVRLMQPISQTDNYPIACQAVKVIKQPEIGRTGVQLTQLRPRAFFKDAVRKLNDFSIRLASPALASHYLKRIRSVVSV